MVGDTPARCNSHTRVYSGRCDLDTARAAGLVCWRPVALVCGCGDVLPAPCRTSRESVCAPCATTYRKRVREVALSGLTVGPRRRFAAGSVVLATLTAPSASRSPHFHGGEVCPCYSRHGGPVDLGEWNASLGGQAGRWNRLLQDVRRLPGFAGVQFFAAKEVQDRGALHLHVLLRRRDGARIFLPTATLRALAIRHGFGHHVDVRAVRDAGGASYVAKYVSKAADARPSVPWRPAGSEDGPITGEVGFTPFHGQLGWRRPHRVPASYRTWSASRRWGSTVKALTAAARVYASSRGALRLDARTGELSVYAGPMLSGGWLDIADVLDGVLPAGGLGA